MKKILSLLIISVLLISVFATSASAISTRVIGLSHLYYQDYVSVYRVASPSVFIGKYYMGWWNSTYAATGLFTTWSGYKYKLYVWDHHGGVSGPYYRTSYNNHYGQCWMWL